MILEDKAVPKGMALFFYAIETHLIMKNYKEGVCHEGFYSYFLDENFAHVEPAVC